VTLSGEVTGEGPPVVLLHGLTATRRYVVMGSTALQRGGHRVIAYDARGHGRSGPAGSPDDYGYDQLSLDLEAVLDHFDIAQAVLAGASMGAHTLLSMALAHPERVGGLVVITPAYEPGGHDDPERVVGLVVITPAYEPGEHDDPERLARWDALSAGLREGGVDGFLAAYGEPDVPARWRDTVLKVIRQRLSLHEHPEALADALRAVPRSRPFQSLDELRNIAVPAVVVADSDEADPGHPLAVGRAYAETIPGARLVTEEPGSSPFAWQGNQLSKLIAEVADQGPAG
jgi:pimeloyl-ACP methyl ester carboxylesterase